MEKRFNIVEIFELAANSYPDKIALVEGEKRITFSDFRQEVDAFAARLIEKGLGVGDRILVFVPMSIDLYRVVLAVFKIGATAVFLDEWVNPSRLEACCKVAECKGLIGSRKFRLLALLSPALRRIPVWVGLTAKKETVKTVAAPTHFSDPALITFTTGSTGTPKAAIRTHGLLDAQFRALVPLLQPRRSDVCLTTLPIVLLINLGSGTTSVIARYNARKPEAMKSGKLAALIQKQGVNTLIASPFFVTQIAQHQLGERAERSLVYKIFTGGAPVFPHEARLFQKAFPDASIQIVYGSTEAEPISSITGDELADSEANRLTKGLPVGKPEDTVQVRILPIADKEIVIRTEKELESRALKPVKTGEIVVSGRHVLNAYLHNPEAVRRNKIMIGGRCWHRTGDSGYVDDTGALYLTGRCNTLINTGTELLPTFLFENYFQNLDGINTGTLLLIDEKITAILEPGASFDRRQTEASVYAISPVIESVRFVAKIPRDPRHNSKIDYEKLRRVIS